eukprot:superscaffoldBa00000505_g5283
MKKQISADCIFDDKGVIPHETVSTVINKKEREITKLRSEVEALTQQHQETVDKLKQSEEVTTLEDCLRTAPAKLDRKRKRMNECDSSDDEQVSAVTSPCQELPSKKEEKKEHSGLVKVPNRGDCWRKEWPYNFQFPGDRMTQDRFESILWSLHLSNPAADKANDRKQNTAEYDRLFKMKPLYTEIVNACKVHFQPYQNIVIDERMVASKACISMKHYMKAKPAKWGYKIFVLADSSMAHMWNFFVYEGKSVHVPGQGLSYTSVMHLMVFPPPWSGLHTIR